MVSSSFTLWQQTNLDSLYQGVRHTRHCLENKIATQEVPTPESLLLPDDCTLTVLCRTFKLSDFERDILLLCVGIMYYDLGK